MALASAVAIRVATSPGTGEGLFVLGAGAGVVMFAGAVAAGRLGLVHWGIGLLGACYVASVLIVGGAPDWWSPAIAVALLASSELAGWSIDSRRRGRDDLAVHVIRLRTLALIAAAALVLALLTHGAGLVGGGGDVVPALAVGALLASVAGFCALMLSFRR
ncbi:MAG TPA: hypothetical protein VGX27_00635 [Candidatus Dormibacteraeota bacterium]|nr:hypothetical protein [Candidatus Dormibacteraeota bacterium]